MKRLGKTMLACLLCAAMFGCGSPLDQSSGKRGGAHGAPLGKGDGHGYGAPIMIPAKQTDQGQPLDDIRETIESGIRDQCPGHKLCVKLRVQAEDIPPFTRCTFVSTRPPQETTVKRGSTVVIVTGSEPCAPPSPDDAQPQPDSTPAPDSTPQPESTP
ncbi:hypothetical protein ACIBHX_06655 [Nonomuraea sp. NPDC050536]|uniref:hypothetical protein n=1 Tax=Nonomuraea sp. NPDC050536 TaxID=3364366 RepID=UPI0037C5035B